MKFEFKNRELSWLEFNERVLQEACDQTVPIIERIRFIGIFSNNLDEFFKVRYATIKRIAVSPQKNKKLYKGCLLYTSPSPRDLSTSRMPSSA